jgi:UDP-N-acetylmuramate--alanine ligase
MRFKQGIAIAGTHGKTTTTSLVAMVLAQGGQDPTFVIGGLLNSAGANARLGAGDLIVVEADESDGSFLNLSPMIAVITNIDMDHMETYGHDIAQLKQSFVDFTQRLPFYGMAVVCIDDPNVREIVPFISKPVTRYGLSEDAELRAVDVRPAGTGMQFRVVREGHRSFDVTLNAPGNHNVRNALAAIAVGQEMGVPDEAIATALAHFNGVGRRFQSFGEVPLPGGGSMTLIDDYGHHPVELEATLKAARGAFPDRRIVLAFQPHRFTRTRDLFEDFVRVLSEPDALFLTEVYAAGEPPIVAADGRSLARAIRVAGRLEPVFIDDIEQMPHSILNGVHDGDVVITSGAGSIGGTAAAICAHVESADASSAAAVAQAAGKERSDV